ncbi:MarR family winged helix-turn-helix transcriptional regulator [Heyndrickxia acidicola]|uniref:MarR family transcriptional regulator n=1 Tax=Heyndrickxia acidicola TaxID=209389 RepID=A0ABU6MH21_9BACI|nr:MarR family transcriptional regulator [Heyndrickxia acidicola]MED1203980.1 MarR family transcriptional regulator [Heyndrickxia acidicola]
MKLKIDQIAGGFIQLLPLVFTKLNKKQLNALDLTHLQAHILEELFQAKEGISITQLGQKINISKQQLTPLITKLAEKKYILKEQNPHDKRAIKLVITERGREKVQERWAAFYHAFTEKIAGVTEEELDDLHYSINKINRIFGRL